MDARHVTCTPGAASYSGGGTGVTTAEVGDYTISLDLEFPAYMVADGLSVTAGVEGSDPCVEREPHRPGAAVLPCPPRCSCSTGRAHPLAGALDTYALSATVALPPRVTGVRYDLTGPARFPADAATGCDTSQDGGALRAREVLDQADVDMRIAATSLTGATDVTVIVAPLRAITDTTEGDQTETVALLPGAPLDLDLDVTSANPDRNARVALGGTLTGVRNGLDRVRYTLSGDAVLPPGANPGCTPTATNKAISCPAPVRRHRRPRRAAHQPPSERPPTSPVAPLRLRRRSRPSAPGATATTSRFRPGRRTRSRWAPSPKPLTP